MDHLLYKNLIFKIVRLWEHGQIVDILGIKHLIHGKVNFDLLFFYFSLFSHIQNNK